MVKESVHVQCSFPPDPDPANHRLYSAVMNDDIIVSCEFCGLMYSESRDIGYLEIPPSLVPYGY